MNKEKDNPEAEETSEEEESLVSEWRARPAATRAPGAADFRADVEGRIDKHAEVHHAHRVNECIHKLEQAGIG